MANNKQKVRVAFLSLTRFEDVNAGSGIPRYARELYSSMVKLQSPLVELKKVVMKSYDRLGDAPSAEINTMLKSMSDFDVVHTPSFFLMARNLRKNTKYIASVHDLNPIMHNTKKGLVWYHLFFKRAVGYTRRRANHIIASSTQTEKELIDAGFDREKITVVQIAIGDRFTHGSPPAKKRGKVFRVGYLGALAPNKNVGMLVEAAKKLPKEGFVTEIWGSKSLLYDTLTEQAGGNENIKFMGFLPEAKLMDIYDSFDAFVFPSLYEGFGLPILEAQARGIPVIIYKKGKIPDEVRKYCFEVRDPDDTARILEKLKDNGYNAATRARAMAYAKSFTWEKTAKGTLKVYSQVGTG
jgi:glycosyltransferase involved in cell wall biosynthesis